MPNLVSRFCADEGNVQQFLLEPYLFIDLFDDRRALIVKLVQTPVYEYFDTKFLSLVNRLHDM